MLSVGAVGSVVVIAEGLGAGLLVLAWGVDIADELPYVTVMVATALPLETSNTHESLDEQHHGVA